MARLAASSVLATLAATWFAASTVAHGDTENLVQNAGFEQAAQTGQPDGYKLAGDVSRSYGGDPRKDLASMCVALDTAADLDGDGTHAGSVAQVIRGIDTARGRWFRFSFRGLPQDHFAVADDQLFMKVEFFARGGASYLDCVTRKIYPLIERDRQDIAVNGVGKKGGAAVWKFYSFDFNVRFAEVDQLNVLVGFRAGSAGSEKDARFFVDDLSLVRIPEPADGPRPGAGAIVPQVPRLIPLGGRWFYDQPAGETNVPKLFEGTSANRLLYWAGRYEAPFAENTSAVLKAGFLDREGKLAEEDRLVPDNVTIAFTDAVMIVRAKNLPNHPVGRFPDRTRSIDGNPNYIREFDFTFYLPLEPEREPRALAMDPVNRNRALPTACGTAIAANGVLFHNPYDAGMTEAIDIMDRCCGHPSPDSRYHYHKYPVCVKSPWSDDGENHSPLIGWAFDGFPIYGPYERRAVMAKDDTGNPLNDFNVHRDPDRGWHYHVTPGKFPYVMGGYWGKVDPRNFLNEPGVRDMGRGPGLLPDPLLATLNVDHDDTLAADEIAAAPERLKALDRNHDGSLTLAEVDSQMAGLPKGMPGRPGGPGPGPARPGGPGAGGPGRGPPPRPSPPFFLFLDVDGDGTISARELDAAARMLREPDRDGDGALSRAELQLTRFRRKG